ncbi:MAG: acetyl-CoA carboxylase biotin carboxyl carrier protein subunit [Bacteroidota bacterium]
MENDEKIESIVQPDYKPFVVLGEEYQTLLTDKYLNRKPYAPIDHKKIYSFIPGTIRKVFVKEGDKVKKGEKLLILEAMKMNNELCTLVNGRVKKVHCKTGEMVTKSQLLIEIV